jgi:molybdopterin-guanine dinucleotide biosynthesis protein
MSIAIMISNIDAEITKLKQARTLLAGAASPAAKKRGRPAVAVKAAAKPAKATVDKPVKKKRKLSPEGRARIAAAAKARWATVKAAAKK